MTKLTNKSLISFFLICIILISVLQNISFAKEKTRNHTSIKKSSANREISTYSTKTNQLWWNEIQYNSLREYLETYQEEFETLIESTADDISEKESDRKIQKSCLIWKTRMIDKLKDKLKEENALVSLLDTWLFSVRMLRFFESGDGSNMFGVNQQLAIDAAKESESMIEDIAIIFIPPAKLPQIRKELYNYALQNPFIGTFKEKKNSSLRLNKKAIKSFSKILSVPLAPVKIAAKAKKDIDSFKTTASRFADIMEDLPQEIRWELELLLFSIDKNQSIYSALESINKLSKSSEELTKIAGKLPDDIRVNIELLMNSVDENKSAQTILANLNTISSQTEVLTKSVNEIPDTISANMDKSIKNALSETQTLVDHISWRVAQLIILIFILASLLSVIIIFCRRKQKK